MSDPDVAKALERLRGHVLEARKNLAIAKRDGTSRENMPFIPAAITREVAAKMTPEERVEHATLRDEINAYHSDEDQPLHNN
jgi:hypothetical protein